MRIRHLGTVVLVAAAVGCGSDDASRGNAEAGAGAEGGGAGDSGGADGGSTGNGGSANAGRAGTKGGAGNGAASNGGASDGGFGTGGDVMAGAPGTGGNVMASGGTAGAGGKAGKAGATTGGAGGAGGSGGTGGAGGAATLVNPAPGSKFFIGANFWNIDWEGQDDFFQSGTNFATTQNPWKQQLLDDLAPYHVLRFMDWNRTNDSNNPQASWDTRKQKTAAQNEPVAFEWQIDLCNRTKKDYWLNVPHESNADYWTKLATLARSLLDPSLRVYVEWSNEVWNSGFPQNAYAASKGKSLGLSGSDAAAAFYVYSSVRVYEAFEAVFGKGSPRLVKVLSGQAAWTGPCDNHMIALKDSTINPKGTKPDFYAIAPYISGKSMDELTKALPTVNQWTTDSKKCASGGGFPLISYEGGSDSYAAGTGCTTLQHDAGMHDLYGQYLTGISGAGLAGPLMQYTHTGSCWGLKEKTSDALSASPKYKGVIDWLAAHP